MDRLQGGERPTIIVSGTESDPHSIGAAASFILNLNRSNVAFSRTQERLIVVCAETLLDHIPSELEDYESAMLWKSLRSLCRREVLSAEVDEVRIRFMGPLVRAPAGCGTETGTRLRGLPPFQALHRDGTARVAAE